MDFCNHFLREVGILFLATVIRKKFLKVMNIHPAWGQQSCEFLSLHSLLGRHLQANSQWEAFFGVNQPIIIPYFSVSTCICLTDKKWLIQAVRASGVYHKEWKAIPTLWLQRSKSCDCFASCVQSYHGRLRRRVWKCLRMAENDRAHTYLHHSINSQVYREICQASLKYFDKILENWPHEILQMCWMNPSLFTFYLLFSSTNPKACVQ